MGERGGGKEGGGREGRRGEGRKVKESYQCIIWLQCLLDVGEEGVR